MVTTDAKELEMVESETLSMSHKCTLTVPRIINLIQSELFYMHIGNISDRKFRLSKHLKIVQIAKLSIIMRAIALNNYEGLPTAIREFSTDFKFNASVLTVSQRVVLQGGVSTVQPRLQ